MNASTSRHDSNEPVPETLKEVEALVDLFLQGPDFKTLQRRRSKRRKTQKQNTRAQRRGDV